MRLPIGFLAAVAVLGLADLAAAQEASAIESPTMLHRVDPLAGTATPVGNIPLQGSTELAVTALARDLDGSLLALSTSQSNPSVVTVAPSRLYRVDEGTAAATWVRDLPPTLPGAATVHPGSGAVWFLNVAGPLTPFGPHFQLLSADPSNPSAAVQGHGELPLPPGPFAGLAFDPAGAVLFTMSSKNSSLWRIDPADPLGGVTGEVGLLGVDVGFGGGLSWSSDGQLLGYSNKTGELFAIDTVTGAGTVLSAIGAPAFSAFAAGGCDGQATPVGTGCPGSGAFVPNLSAAGCPEVGHLVQLRVDQGLGGATALLFVAAATASISLGGGCTLLVAPPMPPPVAVPLGGAGFGTGTVTVPLIVPPVAVGVTAWLQAFVIDPASPIGAAASPALRLQIP